MHVSALLVHRPCFSLRCWIGLALLWRSGISNWDIQNMPCYFSHVRCPRVSLKCWTGRAPLWWSGISNWDIQNISCKFSHMCCPHFSLRYWIGLALMWRSGISTWDTQIIHCNFSHVCFHVSFLRYSELGAHHCGIAASVTCAHYKYTLDKLTCALSTFLSDAELGSHCCDEGASVFCDHIRMLYACICFITRALPMLFFQMLNWARTAVKDRRQCLKISKLPCYFLHVRCPRVSLKCWTRRAPLWWSGISNWDIQNISCNFLHMRCPHFSLRYWIGLALMWRSDISTWETQIIHCNFSHMRCPRFFSQILRVGGTPLWNSSVSNLCPLDIYIIFEFGLKRPPA